ncbi:hypothetical protein F5B22DRAFT_656057 [Xylaria bambusicola]|uniref:uncharacterized protein n=1 Tax=Xylaria bambusicola TaxID=326684 RepID=UPI0020083A9D|nr:uncharacterized protein F5B22DRAFT_656057 [Xylaria bambusicola]KAI0515374.1 hypothetical protein F5B22DRAFT_656057 [Xylaria bambusicola]
MHTVTGKNNVEDAVPKVSDLLRLEQKRHSVVQSSPGTLGLVCKSTTVTSSQEDGGKAKVPILGLVHATKSRSLSQPPSIEDGPQRSCYENHKETSSVAARWVSCQAGFVGTLDEAVSSPRTQPTRSTRSLANSAASIGTTPSDHLPALQSLSSTDNDGLKPLGTEEIDPTCFDLVAPPEAPRHQSSIETSSELLMSAEHLKIIFEDPKQMQKFTQFLYTRKPESVPLLNHYLNLVKALKAIDYSNAIIRELAPINRAPSIELPLIKTISKLLMGKANETFMVLVQEELPAYVTHVWARIVKSTIKQRVKSTLPPLLLELSEGLAEVFCLTDPSRDDHPIIFASEAFHKATQYGKRFSLGRNCRFRYVSKPVVPIVRPGVRRKIYGFPKLTVATVFQGPKTNRCSVLRLKEALAIGKEHCETMLNYRRDGSAFMNLLMIAPLYDNRGNIRYHLGAQVDVSGLLKECAGLGSSIWELITQRHAQSDTYSGDCRQEIEDSRASKDILGDLAEMFSLSELKIVQGLGETGHDRHSEKTNSVGQSSSGTDSKLQVFIKDEAMAIEAPMANSISSSGLTPLTSSSLTERSQGMIEHYLLVRPFPSLSILFVSPSLRVPGILQTPFMSRIGGAQSTRDTITQAFKDGSGVTIKVRWLTRPLAAGRNANITTTTLSPDQGRSRWVHTTPLFGVDGAIGVWMVILVDGEEKQRLLSAPPVDLCNMERRRPFDVNTGTEHRSTSWASDEVQFVDADGLIVEQDDPEVARVHRACEVKLGENGHESFNLKITESP